MPLAYIPLEQAVETRVFGHTRPFNQFDAHRVAKYSPGVIPTIVRPPGNERGAGFRKICEHPTPGSVIYAEGVILSQPNTAVLIQTADCPTLILRNPLTGWVVVTHCGRAALSPVEQPDGTLFNIVTIAVNLLCSPRYTDFLEAHITTGICGNCFVHDTDGASSFVTPFDLFGHQVFVDRSRGALDLFAVIGGHLRAYGLGEHCITRDSTCTKESNALSSHRRGDTSRNSIIVTRRS